MADTISIEPDYSKLQMLFGALEYKERQKIAQRAMHQTAKRVREIAVSHLMNSRLTNAGKLRQHIRIVKTTGAGYMVTIMRDRTGKLPLYRANGRRDFSQQGYLLRFHEGGSYRTGRRKTAQGKNRGELGGIWFMQKAANQAQSIVKQHAQSDLMDVLGKIAKRYGVVVN
jgi:hypothetical protein